MNVRSSQAFGNSQELAKARVQPSQSNQGVFEFLVTPLLPGEVTTSELPERMLRVREAARLLRVSTATIYKLCARGDLAHARVLNARVLAFGPSVVP